MPSDNVYPKPRAIFSLEHTRIEVWCISDLLDQYSDIAKYHSSSQRKAEELPRLFRGSKPILVIAVGTAASPSQESQNGNVVIGTKIFMRNAHPNGENPDSNWDNGPFETVIHSLLSRDAFEIITADLPSKVDVLFLAPPLNASPHTSVVALYDRVSLASVNITNNVEYEQADPLTLASYALLNDIDQVSSIETTFGLIRMQTEAPFLFVGGIVNRLGHFTDDVRPRQYAQNMVAAHNLGITLAWMMKNIDRAAATLLLSDPSRGNPVSAS